MTTKIPNVEFANRDLSINPRMLRRKGRIPATIYGRGLDSVSVEVDKKTFTHLYYSKNPNLIVLTNETTNTRALIKNVQTDPITTEVLNIEFLQVREDETVTLVVPLVLENEAPAIKKGGILWQLMDEVEIECLPKNIPDRLVYDISVLEELDVAVTLGDLKYPDGVKPLHSLDTQIVKISSPKTETEEAAEETASAEPAIVGEE